MTTKPVVAACGFVDGARIAGSSGIATSWTRLGVSAPGNGRTLRAVFGRADETFRRLDRISRALVLAGEAAGITAAIAAAKVSPADVGLVFETSLGSLDADLSFAQSMAAGMCNGAVFAYTLPSTSLGELALRHGLRGPTICLATEPAQRGVALREAAMLLATGEAPMVVAGIVDVLATAVPSVAAQCRVCVVVLASPALGLPAVSEWPGTDGSAYERVERQWRQR